MEVLGMKEIYGLMCVYVMCRIRERVQLIASFVAMTTDNILNEATRGRKGLFWLTAWVQHRRKGMCHIVSQSGSDESWMLALSSRSPFYSDEPWPIGWCPHISDGSSHLNFPLSRKSKIFSEICSHNDCKSTELTIKMTITEPSLDTG